MFCLIETVASFFVYKDKGGEKGREWGEIKEKINSVKHFMRNLINSGRRLLLRRRAEQLYKTLMPF